MDTPKRLPSVVMIGYGLALLTSVNFATGQADLVDAGQSIYGNALQDRGMFDGDRNPSSFIDIDTSLPAGTLTSFNVFVHNVSEAVDVTMQIWRPTNDPANFTLIFERTVTIDNIPDGGVVVQSEILPEEAPAIDDGDLIGWTNHALKAPISYETGDNAHRVATRPIEDSPEPYPQVGGTYWFTVDPNATATYSIAVGINITGPMSTTSTPDTTTAGGTSTSELIISENPNLYGNDVIYRSQYDRVGALNTYIDANTSLPDGILKTFHFYARGLDVDTYIRLQIWRANGTGFTMFWEKRLEVQESRIGLVHTYLVPEENAPVIQKNDLIGWTNEQDVSPVTFNTTAEWVTYYRPIPNTGAFPEVGDNYQFEAVGISSKYSVAVGIDTDESSSASPVRGRNFTSSLFAGLLMGWILICN